MLEKQIEMIVCAYARQHEMLAYKFTSPAHFAVPDRLFITKNGDVFFIEFKAPGKKPTAPQLREHDRLIRQNVAVYVVDDPEVGKQIINCYL